MVTPGAVRALPQARQADSGAVAKAPFGPGMDIEPGETFFLELFAGKGGLTAAVKRAGLRTFEATDVSPDGDVVFLDLLDDATFRWLLKLAKSGRIRWLHGGPPCKTFSRARRRDQHGYAPTLRSTAFPAGLPGITNRFLWEGNILATRFAKIATCVHRAGGWWSLEQPEKSFMWLYKPVLELSRLPGAAWICGDQCCLGGEYMKPTGWLSNAPFMGVLAQKCPGQPSHVVHPRLEGKVEAPDGTIVWRTSLAAAYPQRLCEALAEA